MSATIPRFTRGGVLFDVLIVEIVSIEPDMDGLRMAALEDLLLILCFFSSC